MNRPYLTAREAENLYAHWYDTVANRVREAAAKARGRRDRHRSDLAELHRHLGSVDLRRLLEPEPEGRIGTPVQAASNADKYLAEAEQHHAWGEHKAALVWLQQAYIAVNRATDLAQDKATKADAECMLADGPIPPRPAVAASPDGDTNENEPRGPEGPEGPGESLPIPRQRT